VRNAPRSRTHAWSNALDMSAGVLAFAAILKGVPGAYDIFDTTPMSVFVGALVLALVVSSLAKRSD
jgi:hypothetical protein